MMNPQGGLASLVAALEGGMDPSQGFGIMQFLEQEQQQRMAQRAERLGGLASLLTDASSQGMGYGGAEALLNSQPGPMGPAVQQMLEGAYPGAASAPEQLPAWQERGMETYSPELQSQLQSTLQPNIQSPIFTENPAAQMQMATQEAQLQGMQSELMQPEMAAASDQQWGQLATLLAKAKGKGIDPATAYSSIVAKNPAAAAVFSSDPGRLEGMMEAIFGQSAVKYAGMPSLG